MSVHSKDLHPPARALWDTPAMTPGYDQKLYILAFDHRGSFQKKFFGIEGEPDAEQTAEIADAKHLIFEGIVRAVSAGADPAMAGVLVDEQFGSTVPAEDDQLQAVGGDSDRYDAELRPELMRGAIAEIQAAGVEVDVWKIEGVDERADCEKLVSQARAGGRDDVVCVVLGRGANAAKVDHWLAQAATVDGFVGFAIGRSIWWDPLKAYVDGKIERVEGARRIAENYLRFVKVYEAAEGRAPVAS